MLGEKITKKQPQRIFVLFLLEVPLSTKVLPAGARQDGRGGFYGSQLQGTARKTNESFAVCRCWSLTPGGSGLRGASMIISPPVLALHLHLHQQKKNKTIILAFLFHKNLYQREEKRGRNVAAYLRGAGMTSWRRLGGGDTSL